MLQRPASTRTSKLNLTGTLRKLQKLQKVVVAATKLGLAIKELVVFFIDVFS